MADMFPATLEQERDRLLMFPVSFFIQQGSSARPSIFPGSEDLLPAGV